MYEKQPAVYLLASQRNGALYTGVTADLVSRVYIFHNLSGEKVIMSMQLHTEGDMMAKEKAIVADETLAQMRELEQGREREVVFDTHRFVKRLVENGLTEAQASVLADEQVRLLNNNLATAADLAKTRDELKAEIARIELGLAEVQKEIAKLAKSRDELKAELARVELGLAEVQKEIAKMGHEFGLELAKVDAAHKEGLAKVDANSKLGMAEIQKEIVKMRHEFGLELAKVDAKLAETKAELLKAGSATTKWLIGLLIGSTVTLVTVMLTIMFKILPILNSLG